MVYLPDPLTGNLSRVKADTLYPTYAAPHTPYKPKRGAGFYDMKASSRQHPRSAIADLSASRIQLESYYHTSAFVNWWVDLSSHQVIHIPSTSAFLISQR